MTLTAVAPPTRPSAASACHRLVRAAVCRAGRAVARAAGTLDPRDDDRMDAFVQYWQGHAGVLQLLAGADALAPQVAACWEALEGLALGDDPAEVAARLDRLAAAVEAHVEDRVEVWSAHGLEEVGVGKQAAFTVPYLAFWSSEADRVALLAGAPLVFRTLHRLTEARHARLAARALRSAT
jgi:poly(3-hydroxybutyrate) depolymerase